MSRLYRAEEADVGTTRVCDLPCCAPACERNAVIRADVGAVCNLHYQRWITHRSFENPPRKQRETVFKCSHCGSVFERRYSLAESRKRGRQYCSDVCEVSGRRQRARDGAPARFWAMVNRRGADECWEWKGYRNPLGYGRATSVLFKTKQAHRIAYALTHGDVPQHLHVCHRCDNPPCCNPNHLFLGTDAENGADRDAKGRTVKPPVRRGEDGNSTRLTAEIAKAVVASAEPDRTLGLRYGVSAAAIYNIRHGKAWSHVTGIKRHA